jgi:hypothetical protein
MRCTKLQRQFSAFSIGFDHDYTASSNGTCAK